MTPPGFPEPRVPDSQAGFVLIVDDDDSVRNALLGLLRGTEFRSVGVASARDAFAAVTMSPPRAILLDWVLPGTIDGLAVLKALKSAPATKHIPVVMTSGLKRSANDRSAARRAGAEDLYDKMDLMGRRADLLALLRGAVAKNTAPATWRLLVVEDDPEVQEFIRFSLARREFDVRFADAGRVGFAMARDLRPNLIVLDMGLPDVNGVDVLKLLRADRETRGIPVLAMSAMSKAEGPLASALRELGVDDYLPKPFGENELLQRMSRLLGRIPAPRTTAGALSRGRVRLDVESRRVWVEERLIEHIGFKQFDLLHALICSPDGVSRRELQSALWSGVENPKALNMTVCRLRKVLGFDEGEGIIAIPHGYKLVG